MGAEVAQGVCHSSSSNRVGGVQVYDGGNLISALKRFFEPYRNIIAGADTASEIVVQAKRLNFAALEKRDALPRCPDDYPPTRVAEPRHLTRIALVIQK